MVAVQQGQQTRKSVFFGEVYYLHVVVVENDMEQIQKLFDNSRACCMAELVNDGQHYWLECLVHFKSHIKTVLQKNLDALQGVDQIEMSRLPDWPLLRSPRFRLKVAADSCQVLVLWCKET